MEAQQRYLQLKSSVQALRSEVRSRAPCRQEVRAEEPRGKLALPFDAAAAGLEPSASMRLLELQFNMVDQERQEELAAAQAKVTEKLKHLDAFRAKCERRIRKVEDGYFAQKGSFRKVEDEACRRLAYAEEDFIRLASDLASKYKQLQEEHKCKEDQLVARYEETIASLREEREQDKLSRETLEEQFRSLEEENIYLRDRTSILEIRYKAATDEFHSKFREQENDWSTKLQGMVETHEEEAEFLKAAMENERSSFKAEKQRLSSELEEYRAQKIKEIDTLERHIRLALETKDSKIAQLKNELQKLQLQLDHTSRLFQDVN